jgi:hypothetical protein
MSLVVGASHKAARTVDPTIYPVEEKVGEDILQRWILELLRPLIDRWFRQRGVLAFVGADQFNYYRPHAPTERVSPDIYVLPGVRPTTRVSVWKTWERGIIPSFGLEIVSKDWEKDYIEAPERYAAAGIPELVVFDPSPERHPERVAWQHFRRIRNRPLTRVDVSRGDRMRVRAFGCFLRAIGHGDSLRLRLAVGPRGDELVPTAAEAALARVAELEAQLRKRRRRPSR